MVRLDTTGPDVELDLSMTKICMYPISIATDALATGWMYLR